MNVTFPSSASLVNAFTGCFLWPGQSISQTFTTSSLNSIDSLSISFVASGSNLWSNLQWGVSVNNIRVGTFVMGPTAGGQTGNVPISQSFSFHTISGSGTYTVALSILTGAGQGDGYVTLGYGTASLQSV